MGWLVSGWRVVCGWCCWRRGGADVDGAVRDSEGGEEGRVGEEEGHQVEQHLRRVSKPVSRQVSASWQVGKLVS